MNVRLHLFLLALFILFCSPLFAQNLTGTVTSAGKPIQGSSVSASPSGTGASTDIDGNYRLTLKPGIYKISFSAIGFEKKTLSIQLNAGESKVLNAELTPSAEALKEVVVVGSRGAGRTKIESPVPVDVINVNQVGQTTAKPDLMSQLNQAVPSFNYNKQSGGDGSDAIDFASLRGLGFDQTLVLVNGKRRHLSAFVNEVGTRGRGNSGTDLNAIPEAAIDHVEILRDGASAQYGSDAIAGVINIVLKKDINHLNINAGFSGYNDQKYNTLNNVDPSAYYTGKKFDGQTFTLNANYGLAIGKNGGFINIGANYQNQGKTFRAVQDTNWRTNPEALGISRARRAFGDGSVISGGGMYNLEIPLNGTKTTFYSFGGYNYKHSNVYAYTRSWNYNNGLRQNPTKFPTDANGNLIFVPGIMKVHGYPDGSIGPNNVYYNPQEDVYIKDASAAFGFKGTTPGDWDWDISNNLGRNDFHYWGEKTFNASLPYIPGQPIQTRFDDGGFNFLQNTANADITKHFSNVAQGLQLSFGGEFRYERYQLYPGEVNSYLQGTATLPGVSPTTGKDTSYTKASGSQGYPGYQPSDATTAHRTAEAAYAEATLDITKAWLIDGAARFEHYSDFGSVSTFKFATRYKLTDNFNLRGSASTGFRAPTLQQINFSNTNTSIIGGNLVYTKLVPNYSAIAKTAGIPKLTQETSHNYSLGFTWQPVHNLTLTVDGYQIAIKNRIVISGLYAQGDPTLGAPLNNLLASQGVGLAQFFANAVNTTNRGIDIVVDYKKRWGKNHFTALLAGNIQNLTINKINIPFTFKNSPSDSATFFNDREQYFLKASAPKAKFSLNLEYGANRFAFGTHLTYFGDVKELGFGEADAPANAPDKFFPYVALDNGSGVVPEIFEFKPKITTDLYVSYKINSTVSWTAGVDNLFNVHPDKAIVQGSINPTTNSSFGDSESGGPFEAVQMGFNGMRIFTKLAFHF
ncbi:iron complex outermembrane recepter protein [Mucilaginibacter sp. OK268]|uniref:TonB-dependent receptor n=1 Tax=Mucilaginibacter sp. OK268 TaxID=1881048 RepID=UPI0008874EC5|nr:TonB-dependent receptor [Mucilaginibacter sp. OK268]SDP04820.1 iron complex outermembrane recepter protein [Mucilaginibacter sp. OK268]